MSTRRHFLATAAVAALGARALRAEEPKGKPGQTKNTKFAVNVEAWWSKLPFLQRLEKTAELGFPAVEFWPWENKDIPAVAKACARLKLDIAQFTAWGFKPGMNDPKNHDAFVQKVEKSCEVAHQLNCKMMTVVAGDDIPGMTQEQMHKHVIEALKRAAPVAEKHKVMLILEPMNIRVDHKGHCLYGSEKSVKICRAVNSPYVKLNWDLYHMHISEGDLCGHLKEGFDQLGYVQIADHPGRKEPGTGEINYSRVYRQLRDLGYKGYVGLELWPMKDEVTAAWAVHKSDEW